MTQISEPLLTHRSLPEGTVTFLFSDIVGSTPHWENHPDLMSAALQIHNQALQAAVLENNGVIFKIVGDAFQVAFPLAPQALKAAVSGQQRLQSAAWNELGPLKVRMGIHTGEAYLDHIGDEYAVSHTKNRVARIMSAGHGGQILLSEESANLCKPILDAGLRLIDLGDQYLKGLARPEHIYQVVAPGLPEKFPPLVVSRHPNHNLPTKLTRFVGREKETTQLQSLLAQHRLVTIIGPGGVGKTRLALNAAHHQTDKFKDGVYFVSLDPIASPVELAPTIAAVLQYPLRGQQDPAVQLINFIQTKEMLLVLDNFEHILEGSQLLADILQGTSNLKLLVTSREALNILEEWRFQLGGLSYSAGSSFISPYSNQPVESEKIYDAVQLFVDRARQARPDFSLNDEYPHVQRICHLVEGYPLAIELAAAWVRSLSCAEIAAEIEANISILSTTLRNLPERHRSLQAIFNQSWDQLDSEVQDVFMRLSVFRGGFQRDAAERVAGASLLDLSNLVDKSLLRWESNRYQIHRLLRHYAEEKLSTYPKTSAQTIDRHCSYYASFLYERYIPVQNIDYLPHLSDIDSEIDNIRLAWEWAVESNKLSEIRVILLSLDVYFQLRSGFQEWWHMLNHALQKLENLPASDLRDITLTDLLTSQTWMGIRLGKFDEAEDKVQRSLNLLQQTNTSPPKGMGMDPKIPQSILFNIRGDYQQAVTVAKNGLDACIARNDYENIPFFYYALASATSAIGDFTLAGQYAQRAIDLCREQGNAWFMAYCLNEKGIIERAQDNYETAKSHFQESYHIRESFQDPEGTAVALNHLGQTALLEEDYSAALSLFERSLGLYQDLADQGGLASTMAGLGEAHLGLHNLTLACKNLIKAFQIAIEIEYVPFVFAALTGAGHLLVKVDHPQDGLKALTLVLNHPSSSREVKTRAERYLKHTQNLSTDLQKQSTASQPTDEIWHEAKSVLRILEDIHLSRSIQ